MINEYKRQCHTEIIMIIIIINETVTNVTHESKPAPKVHNYENKE